MRAGVLAVLIVLTLVSCASTHHSADTRTFHRYPACVERMVGGRVLHDPGWVVGEADADTGIHVFRFLSTYWGRVIEVTRVNRFCTALRARFDMSDRIQSATPFQDLPSPRN